MTRAHRRASALIVLLLLACSIGQIAANWSLAAFAPFPEFEPKWVGPGIDPNDRGAPFDLTGHLPTCWDQTMYGYRGIGFGRSLLNVQVPKYTKPHREADVHQFGWPFHSMTWSRARTREWADPFIGMKTVYVGWRTGLQTGGILISDTGYPQPTPRYLPTRIHPVPFIANVPIYAAILMAWTIPLAIRRAWRRHRHRCVRCAYELDDTMHRCPECGRPVSRSSRTTPTAPTPAA